jgi:hypothetical protein
MAAIRGLVSKSNRFGGQEGKKPYRGKLEDDHGVIRSAWRASSVSPARELSFRLIAVGEGCVLTGELKLWKVIRIPVTIYLSVCILSEL